MIAVYDVHDGNLRKRDAPLPGASLPAGVWIDLVDPTREEEHAVEAAIGAEVPSREEMREIETSSQIYREGDAAIATVRVVRRDSGPVATLTDATFILTPRHLVTVRYVETRPFSLFTARTDWKGGPLDSLESIVVAILEAIVDRAADILEEIGVSLDAISGRIFSQAKAPNPGIASDDLRSAIQNIGRSGDLAAKVRESLHSLNRAVAFLRELDTMSGNKALLARINVLRRDIRSLQDHSMFLASNMQFLLDSTLDLINIQQNAIIKIFSVAAVIFLPPTLIASIYGMNFAHIPELQWPLGYPFALASMILSAILPYLFFRRRGWL